MGSHGFPFGVSVVDRFGYYFTVNSGKPPKMRNRESHVAPSCFNLLFPGRDRPGEGRAGAQGNWIVRLLSNRTQGVDDLAAAAAAVARCAARALQVKVDSLHTVAAEFSLLASHRYTTCQISSGAPSIWELGDAKAAGGGMQSVGNKGVALRQCRKSMLSTSMRKKCKPQLNPGRVSGRSLWRRHLLEGLSVKPL